jgi:hypothetical protein
MKIYRPHLLKTGVSGSLSPVKNIITETSISNDSTVNFTDLFDGYDRYELELIQVIPSTDSQEIVLRTSVDNGSSYQAGANTYSSTLWAIESDGTALDDDVEDDQLAFSSFDAGEDISSASDEQGYNGVIRLYQPSGGYQFSMFARGWYKNPAAINMSWQWIAVGRNQTDTLRVNAVQVRMNSGNLSTGTIRLIGIR